MKRFFFFVLLSLFSFSSFAQTADLKTDSFKVEGNCGMCKKRIEDAAYIKGVKRADWNKDSQTLVVIYKPSKTSAEAIQQHIAGVGHNAGTAVAKEADYKALPDCCQYKTNSCNH